MPRTTLGRIILGFFSAILIAALGVVGSVWIEYRHPSDDAKRALLPAAQRVLTKAVVNAVGRQAERYLRRQAEARLLETGATLEQTIAHFLDERVPLAQRRFHAYRLAMAGTPAASAALERIFATAPVEDRVFMAQLIGTAGNPAGKRLLLAWLADSDDRVVVASIRGLGGIGGEDVRGKLAELLGNAELPAAVRVAAATGLGAIGSPAAAVALAEFLPQVLPGDLAAAILTALGRQRFALVAQPIQEFLTSPATSSGMRVAALEALANSSADAVPFLLSVAGADGDAQVRASAAWAVTGHGDAPQYAPALMELAEHEPNAEVRRRLYEALLVQAGIAGDRLLPLALAETDVAARVAGFNALGVAAQQSPGSLAAFDERVVPELQRLATSPNSLNIQMRAVFALRRAQTSAAQAALAEIASRAAPQVATAARNGLLKGS